MRKHSPDSRDQADSQQKGSRRKREGQGSGAAVEAEDLAPGYVRLQTWWERW